MPARIQLKTIVHEASRAGPILLITGGVHGDEFEPMAAIRTLSKRISKELRAGVVTLVPVVNEPAFQSASRTGPDDLDLARVCPGNRHGSISLRIADALSILIREADYYIDLHTGGIRLSIFPLAGYLMHQDDRIRASQRRMAHAFNLPLVWGTDPMLEGRSLSVARDANVSAIYVEYYGGVGCEPQAVRALVEGCLNVMASLDMIGHPAPESRVIHDIQETTSGTGVLQCSHLAPIDGFFEAAVSLGECVKKGQPIGWVVDVLGLLRVPVPAETTGLVACLRHLSSVQRGASLGYVIEV